MGVWQGLVGIVLPATVIMGATLSAAIWPPLQGILLTAMTLAFFITAMMLMPKVVAGEGNFWGFRSRQAAALPTA